MRPPTVAAILWLTFACSSPTEPHAAGLTAQASDSRVHLQNSSAHRLFYFILERESAALADWAACVEPACPSLAPGASTSLPYGSISGYAPGRREVIVWWWDALPTAEGWKRPGPIHSLVLPL